jgi:hypothetical protein
MPLELNGTTGVQGNSGALVLGTAVSASGTSVDFTGIPSWVKRVTVTVNNLSANAFGRVWIQLGTGGTPTTSGYTTNYNWISTNNSTVRSNTVSSAFPFFGDEAGDSTTGAMVFTLITGNTWVGMGGSLTTGPNAGGGSTFGSIALAGVLNMVRVTTSSGTPTFDSGTINILYE